MSCRLFINVFVVLMLVLPGYGEARERLKKDYSDKEIVDILKDEGYRAVAIVDERVIEIKVDGRSHFLTVYEDGDLQLYFGVTGYDIPVAAMNEWNMTKRLSRAYIDHEGDPVIEADLLANAGYSDRHLVEFVKVFVEVVNVFRNFLLSQDRSGAAGESGDLTPTVTQRT